MYSKDFKQIVPTLGVERHGRRYSPCYPSAIAIDTANNYMYLTDASLLFGVMAFTSSFEFITAFKHRDMKCPWGIAVHDSNIYVTDVSVGMLFYFSEDTGFCKVTCVDSREQFSYPFNLALSEEGDVFLADRYNNRIQVLEGKELKYQRSITHPSLNHPIDVKLTQQELYVLTHNTYCCIHVFTQGGEMLRSIITSGKKRFEVRNSYFFCIDTRNKNLLIGDVSSKAIKIFSNQGQHLHTLKLRDGKTRVQLNPMGFALTKESNLVVSYIPNAKLVMFSVSSSAN